MTKSIKLFAHLLAWTLFYLVMLTLLDTFLESSGTGDFLNMRLIAEIAFILLLFLVVPFYLFYYLWQTGKKNGKAVLMRLLATVSVFVLPWLYFLLDEQAVTVAGYSKLLTLVVFFAFLGYLFKGLIHGFQLKQEKAAVQQQLWQTELAFLKGQISPHFLFNTLNNIDSLIRINPDEASRSLISMSGIMRYMIYDSKENSVPLKDELHYLENLLALYNLRFSDGKLIQYSCEADAGDFRIAPMLLIPIAENSFKHYSNRYSKDGIKISVSINGSRLRLIAVNAFDPSLKKAEASGFGLQTLKRRLDLLSPGDYTMNISEASNNFTIVLDVPLCT